MQAVIAALALIMVQQPIPEISSAYTSIENCEAVEGPALINERCNGYGGWTLFVGASEHSTGLAYSDRARDEQMAQTPLSAGLYQSFEPQIEWRVRREDAGWAAFATIHRWTSTNLVFDDATGEAPGDTVIYDHVLVVTALREDGPIGACHAGYVDVTEVYDANTVARQFADAMAAEFRCGIDAPYEIGAVDAVILAERGRL